MFACNIDLQLWSLGVSWDEYADIRVASLTDTVHDTTHDCYMEMFESVIFSRPLWHLVSDTLVHILREDLELDRTRPPAPRTTDDLRSKSSESHRLHYISTDLYLQ